MGSSVHSIKYSVPCLFLLDGYHIVLAIFHSVALPESTLGESFGLKLCLVNWNWIRCYNGRSHFILWIVSLLCSSQNFQDPVIGRTMLLTTESLEHLEITLQPYHLVVVECCKQSTSIKFKRCGQDSYPSCQNWRVGLKWWCWPLSLLKCLPEELANISWQISLAHSVTLRLTTGATPLSYKWGNDFKLATAICFQPTWGLAQYIRI